MNYKMKTLAAALALAASASAHAAVDNYSSHNSELLFSVYDTVSKNSFSFDLSALTGSGTFTGNTTGTFVLNNFVGASAVAAPYSFTWDLAALGGAAWTNFAAGAGSNANWQWNVVAGDNTVGAERYLSTVANTVTDFSNVTSASVGNMGTTSSLYTAMNAGQGATAATATTKVAIGNDSASYFQATRNGAFSTSFKDDWKNQFVDSTDATGTTMSLYSVISDGNNAAVAKLNSTASFNGSSLTIGQVAAVPEADTWAMLVAGLGLMGFIARRRTAV